MQVLQLILTWGSTKIIRMWNQIEQNTAIVFNIWVGYTECDYGNDLFDISVSFDFFGLLAYRLPLSRLC